jgi:ABC-type transport system substrate-binding protein
MTRTSLNYTIAGLFLAFMSIQLACKSGGQDDQPSVLNVRLEASANICNPLLPSSGYARYVAEQVFITLGKQDLTTTELKPYLAKAIPTAVPVADGPYKGAFGYTFEINEAATWDNGTSITANDVEFTLKLIFCPTVQADIWRSYFEDLQGIETDPANSRRFTIYMKQYYLLGLESLCLMPIYPAYHYDPNNHLRNIKLSDLLSKDSAQRMEQDQGLVAFGTQFADPKYSTDKNFIASGTAYSVEMFDPAQGVTLVRKPNWWGHAIKDNPVFRNYPDKIVYKVAKADDVVINMLQAGELDIATSIPPSKYIELQKDANLSSRYDFKTFWTAQYNRIMINTRDPRLSDKRVRQAIAQAVDYDYMLNSVQHGMATRTVSPINPNKPYYAKNITPYQFNPQAAKDLLAAAGWTDTNGDGTVDKLINGKKTELVLKYTTITGLEVQDMMAASVQASLQKAGIKIEIKSVDLPTLTKSTQAGEFELAAAGAAQDPGNVDLYQFYHSNSLIPNGDNRTGISNARLDQLLTDIRRNPDAAQRQPMYIEMQQILYDEVPEVYLYAPVTRYIASKKFRWTPTALRPGFWAPEFEQQ